MPEPFTLALFLLGLKAATVKTMAAPVVKGVTAATSAAYSTGAASTVAGSVILGVTLTSAAALGIGAAIHRAVSCGYMSGEEGARYARQVEKMPLYRQQKILADVESTAAEFVELRLIRNGVFGW